MILYTWHDFFPDEAKVLNCLLEKGVQWLHIYKPDKDIHQVEQLIDQITVPFRQQLIIHFYYPLANKYLIGGIHVSKNTVPFFQKHFSWISRSAHQINELLPIDGLYTHIMVSPIFNSISKKNHSSQWNIGWLTDFFKNQKTYNIKYIALGGITLSHYEQLLKVGFDDAAFLGDFWMKYFKTKKLSDAYDFIKYINSCQKTE